MNKENNHLAVKAAYLGTFDPLTLGHYDIVCRASAIFPHLVIGIGYNTQKTSLFSSEERLEQILQVTNGLTNVEVKTFSGLAVDFAKENGVSVFVRGLRTEADYVYEMQMAMMKLIFYSLMVTYQSDT